MRKDKYQKWIDDNCSSLSDKTIVVLGATGSIGKEIVDIISSLSANVIIAVRSASKGEALILEMQKKYPQINYKLLLVDMSNRDSIDSFVKEIKQVKVDYFISCAGVYHLNQKILDDGLEIHFATNYFNHIYLIENIEAHIKKDDGKIIIMESISHRFFKINFNDLMSLKIKNKTKVYARSKRLLVYHTLNKINNGSPLILCHPGISATSLFSSEKGGFSSTFNKLIVPIMKKIFISPKKASLSVILSLFKDVPYGYQVGPRGLFHIWGYPKIYKFARTLKNKNKQEKIVELYNKKINEICKGDKYEK